MTLDVSFPEDAPIDTTPQCPPSNSRFHVSALSVRIRFQLFCLLIFILILIPASLFMSI
ncbi:hypothetical protein SLEP1_g11704 [Rubroshorea leprosula]|nr:hypothetical protein SLEP1_g11704 [Rubroshorea leprosula]